MTQTTEILSDTKTITSGTFSDGSFGLRAKRNGDAMTVWFCGKTVRNVPNGPYTNISPRPCAHRTRSEARACTGAEAK